MKPQEYIIQQAKKSRVFKSADLLDRLGISRQALAYHLRKLVASKRLVKINSTRNAAYALYDSTKDKRVEANPSFTAKYRTRGLKEDKVFDEAAIRLNLKRLLSEPAYRIVGYAFTEMLNNAIDHSRSPFSKVFFKCEDGIFEFQVIDAGVGVYENIRSKFKFKNHFDAVEHLLKGKQTTDPEKHSGQGIFFTSKIADKFVLESSKLRLIIDNKMGDVVLKDVKEFKGTKVVFCIKQKTKKSLKKLFDEYSGNDYEFDKTRITVRLSSRTGGYISRSQAKRLLFGLDKFKRIVLDFSKVDGVGQGFADEIFRVFQNSHPDIRIEPVNVAPSVSFMINRAISNSNA